MRELESRSDPKVVVRLSMGIRELFKQRRVLRRQIAGRLNRGHVECASHILEGKRSRNGSLLEIVILILVAGRVMFGRILLLIVIVRAIAVLCFHVIE